MTKIGKYFWKCILEIPILGPSLLLLNAWLFDGDAKFSRSLPGPWRVFKHLAPGLSFASVFTLTVAWFALAYQKSATVFAQIADLNLQIFPNLLGVGLAIFLVLFSINKDSLSSLAKALADQGIPPAIVAAQLAYPIVVFSLNIMVSALIKLAAGLVDEPVFNFRSGLACLFIFIYSFVVIFDVLLSIYFIASKSLATPSSDP